MSDATAMRKVLDVVRLYLRANPPGPVGAGVLEMVETALATEWQCCGAGACRTFDESCQNPENYPTAEDFDLQQRSAESLDAERYRYLRNIAGQVAYDDCGPMVCAGCGDNFEYLRGEEVDAEVDQAIAEWKAHGSPTPPLAQGGEIK